MSIAKKMLQTDTCVVVMIKRVQRNSFFIIILRSRVAFTLTYFSVVWANISNFQNEFDFILVRFMINSRTIDSLPSQLFSEAENSGTLEIVRQTANNSGATYVDDLVARNSAIAARSKKRFS